MDALQQQQTLSSSCRFRPLDKPNIRSLQPASISRIPTSRKLKRPFLLSAVLADDVSSGETSISNPTKLVELRTSTGLGERMSETGGRKFAEEDLNSSSLSLSSLPGNGSTNYSSEKFSPPSSSLSSTPSSRQVVDLPTELRGIKDYIQRASELIQTTDSSPRWFCPLECGVPPQDAPLLLFLPGMDGTGLGMIRHYESLGRMFEVRCLHIPITDRTPIEGLSKLVENVLREESYKTPSKPIYLVGDSLGGALALAIAARNPKMDLVLVLANPSTSFSNSQLQPILPLLDNLPDQIYQGVPFLLSFIMGDPIRMALATIDKKLPDVDKAQALRDNLVSMLPMLPTIADILPRDLLKWKLKLLKEAASYANSRLHAVKVEVLILASGKDQMLPSRDEARRLSKTLSNCVVRYYKDSGHTLLLEDGLDLGTVIRGTQMYRKSKKFDPVVDFVYPTTNEFEEAYQRTKIMRQMTSPVFFSTKEDGTIIRGLSGVPEEGPILLVGYHMLMGLELPALISEFMKRKQLIRGVAHPILFTRQLEQGLAEPGFNDDARVFGGLKLGKKNFFKVLSRRECALLYPGGAREALHRKGEAYKLFWPERSEFVRTAARFGVTIVPFGVVGEDDLFELVLDYNDIQKIPYLPKMFEEVNRTTPQVRRGQSGEVGAQELHMPLLLPKAPGRIYFLFGKPFPTAGRKELENKAAADIVYAEMKAEVQNCLNYLLKKREEDPYRAFLPRFLYESLWGEDWQAHTFDP
ncbi:hypothetical protein GOP47_0030129 [Adiantum capillus-veneris]|nr:hypothetical protein GOP47_0030129 [Adiantum capillus-veneris]